MTDLKTKIRNLVKGETNGVWTAAIGLVAKTGTKTVDVQIKNKVLKSGSETTFPVLKDVPVLYPKTNNLCFYSPLALNDPVLLIFLKYNRIGLFDNISLLLSKDSRMFSINDAVCIPGFFLGSDALPPASEGEGIIYHESGAYIKFNSNGDIEIKGNRVDISEL